jgi:hypothetical protein
MANAMTGQVPSGVAAAVERGLRRCHSRYTWMWSVSTHRRCCYTRVGCIKRAYGPYSRVRCLERVYSRLVLWYPARYHTTPVDDQVGIFLL